MADLLVIRYFPPVTSFIDGSKINTSYRGLNDGGGVCMHGALLFGLTFLRYENDQ